MAAAMVWLLCLLLPSTISATALQTFARYSQPHVLDTLTSPQQGIGEQEEDLETYPGSGWSAARKGTALLPYQTPYTSAQQAAYQAAYQPSSLAAYQSAADRQFFPSGPGFAGTGLLDYVDSPLSPLRPSVAVSPALPPTTAIALAIGAAVVGLSVLGSTVLLWNSFNTFSETVGSRLGEMTVNARDLTDILGKSEISIDKLAENLDSIGGLSDSVLRLEASSKEVLNKVATNVENANRGYLNTLESIATNIKSVDDNTKSGLGTIGANVQDNKDSQESILDLIAQNIKDFATNSNDVNERVVTNIANLDKNGKNGMAELRATIQSFDSLNEISINNLNSIAENIKNLDRNTEHVMDSFKTGLVNSVSSLGATNKDVLVTIAQNMQNAGDSLTSNLKSVITNLKLLDEHSYSSLADIAKNMETEGLSEQAVLSNILTIANNIKNMDMNNKDSLDSIKTIIQNAATSATTANKDALVDIATKVGGAGDGFLSNLKLIADNVQLLDQHNLASLGSISSNIETNGLTNKASADSIGEYIETASMNLDKVVTNLGSIDDNNKQSLASLNAGLMSSLGVLEGSSKGALTTLADNVANSGNQYLNKLESIADNIRTFDEHQTNNGNQYADDIKKISESIGELDTNSQAALADIVKGLEQEGLNTNDFLTSLGSIASNLRSIDTNNKDSLDSINDNIIKSISNAEGTNKDALTAIGVKLGSTGDGVLDYLEHLVDNLKLLDQHSLASLNTIGTNIHQGGVNSREELQNIVANIKDNTGSVDNVVTNLMALNDDSVKSQGDLRASLIASLAEVANFNKDSLASLAGKVETSGASSLTELKNIAANIMQFDTNAQNSGSKSEAELKLIAQKIQDFDSSSQTKLVDIRTGMDSSKAALEAALTAIGTNVKNTGGNIDVIADNIKTFDGQTFSALNSLSSDVKTQLLALASSNMGSLSALTAQVTSNGADQKGKLESLVSILGLLDTHSTSSLEGIKTNLANAGTNSAASTDKVAANVLSTGHDTRDKLAELVKNIADFDAGNQQQLGDIESALKSNLVAISANLDAGTKTLKDFDSNAKSSIGEVKTTLDTTGASTRTALTSISDNVKTAGDGQKSSLMSLLSALKSLDDNNESGLESIEHSITDTQGALQTLAAQTLHSRSSSHHSGHGVHTKGFHNETIQPVYEFIDESTVNVEPAQTNNHQSGITAVANGAADDQNNPSTGEKDCGTGLLSAIGCNIKLTLGKRKKRQEEVEETEKKKSNSPLSKILPSRLALQNLIASVRRNQRVIETNTVLDTIAANQQTNAADTETSLAELIVAFKDLDDNNKKSQDKVGDAVGELKTPINTISSNVAAHHTAHHSSTITETVTTRDILHHHDDHGDHHDDHEPSAFVYTPVVRIIANRTTNLKPLQSGNVQADGSADSAATSSDENNPTEGASKCTSSLLGSIFCNLQLGIGRIADRRVDNMDEDGFLEDGERVNGTDREPRFLGKREKEFAFDPLSGIFDFLLDVVLGPKKTEGNLNLDLNLDN